MLAKLASEHWRTQYRSTNGAWKSTALLTGTEIVYNKLMALGKTRILMK